MVDEGGEGDTGEVLGTDLRVVHVVSGVGGGVVLGWVVGVGGTAAWTLEVVHGRRGEERWTVED